MHYKQAVLQGQKRRLLANRETVQRMPKFDMLLFIVANQQGLDRCANPTRLSQVLSQAHLQLHSTYMGKHSEASDTFQHMNKTHNLKYNPNDMVYTDGSLKKESNSTGAGVYGILNGKEICLKIHPSKPGPVHTINRAELNAIHTALCHWKDSSDLIIATDSANEMQSINKQLHNPNAHKHHQHKLLLQAIADMLVPRAQQGMCASIVKLKSHTGIRGNEAADALAKAATESWDVDSSNEHIEPYNDMVWLRNIEFRRHGTRTRRLLLERPDRLAEGSTTQQTQTRTGQARCTGVSGVGRGRTTSAWRN